jgi:hypothetical protein
VTLFDHFFILYTGFIIGIICFVFPLIISVFNFLERKRLEVEKKINAERDKTVNLTIENISSPDTKPEERANKILSSSRHLKREKRRKLFNQFYYNPQFRLWIILIPLLITLGMCIIDVFTSQVYNLTYYSLFVFTFALYFLLDTLVRTVKIIKESVFYE